MNCQHTLEKTLADLASFIKLSELKNDKEMFVAFDFDNTLKVLDRGFKRRLRDGASEVLEYLSKFDKCKLVLITAISPSKMNLETLFIELDDLGLRKYFVKDRGDEVDGQEDGRQHVMNGDGWLAYDNIILSPNKPDALMEYYGLKNKEDFPQIHFVDDEVNNIYGFMEAIPSSECYLVK